MAVCFFRLFFIIFCVISWSLAAVAVVGEKEAWRLQEELKFLERSVEMEGDADVDAGADVPPPLEIRLSGIKKRKFREQKKDELDSVDLNKLELEKTEEQK